MIVISKCSPRSGYSGCTYSFVFEHRSLAQDLAPYLPLIFYLQPFNLTFQAHLATLIQRVHAFSILQPIILKIVKGGFRHSVYTWFPIVEKEVPGGQVPA